ncbi:uroporphyrinogen-III C-methyltransferase [Halomonas sp. M4R1S46]|uniref:uroporphyrinogen-III C-methyltransferase n=1 Tax=Halomonas sp. M4R1S46 TaxID=2982692 RepID=UPI0021E3E84F|nr:uroporphyrinogen-III C-methyltransferase [Halomonas sp. M4R1S46]UYG07911.1 uroporphyrinogen-III C-methyltransferase [Halomonas sp. M4R1S46]
MSKQQHDQDEQQTPSGDAQGGADSATTGTGAEAGKGGGSSSRRSRRRGKGSGSAAHHATAEAKADARPSSTTSTSESQATPAGDKPGETGQAAAAAKAADPAEADAAKREAGKATDASASSAKVSDSAADGTRSTSGKATDAAAAKRDTAKAAASSSSSSGAKATSSKASGGDAKAQPASAGQGAAGTPGGGGGRGGSGKGSKTGAVALGLVVLLGAGGALFGWQVWQKLDAQQQRLAALPAQAASQSALDDLAGRLESGEQQRNAALDEAVSTLRSDFSDYRQDVDQTLDKVLQELSSEQQTDERDWLHAEAAYLLRLANQRLQLERDVQGAAALLRTADERLREADNPALMPVRREIASELAALESVPRVDRTGLYLALNAQQEQIAGRPLAQDIEEIAADSTIEEAPSGGWQSQLARFGGELKDLVTVRQHDEALEALISPEQESYLRQSVRLVLEQAQLALLKEEPPLFEASLEKALTLIQGYYDTDDSGVQAVLSRLEELKGRAIRPELPDISGSQQALASFIEHRFEADNGGQGDEA